MLEHRSLGGASGRKAKSLPPLPPQELSSSPTSFSSSPAASLCSSWRWRWASTPAKGASQPGERSALSSRVSVLPHPPARRPASISPSTRPSYLLTTSFNLSFIHSRPMLSAVGDTGSSQALWGPTLIYPEEEGTPQERQYKVTNEKSSAEPCKGSLQVGNSEASSL